MWTDLDETLWTGSVCDKDELIGCFFDEDPDPDLTSRIFKVILGHYQIGSKTI